MRGRDDHLAEVDLTEEQIDAMMAEAEPVEVVGPTERLQLGRSRFQLYRNASGRFQWRLRAGDGRVIAVGGEDYQTKAEAMDAINEVRRDAERSAVAE